MKISKQIRIPEDVWADLTSRPYTSASQVITDLMEEYIKTREFDSPSSKAYKRTSIYVDHELLAKFREAANNADLSIDTAITQMVRKYLSQNPR